MLLAQSEAATHFPGQSLLGREAIPPQFTLPPLIAGIDCKRTAELGRFVQSILEFSPDSPSVISSAEFPMLYNLLQKAREDMQSVFESLKAAPRDAVSTLFSCPIGTEPKLLLYPVAVSIRLEGYDYGRIADKYFRKPGDPKSLGTTVSFRFLPQESQGRLLLINEGDGITGQRTDAEIQRTEQHELMHALFNCCFRKSDFLSTDDLTKTMETMPLPSDYRTHADLAHRLYSGMAEASRSEIIAYYSTGDRNLTLQNVGAHYWQEHLSAVKEFIRNAAIDGQEGDQLYAIYHGAALQYFKELRNYAALAKGLYESVSSENPLNTHKITAFLLETGLYEISERFYPTEWQSTRYAA